MGRFSFFFFFFLNKYTSYKKYFTIGTYRSMYKAERNTYKFTVYNFANLTISTFRSVYKAENKDVYFAVLSLKKLITECES